MPGNVRPLLGGLTAVFGLLLVSCNTEGPPTKPSAVPNAGLAPAPPPPGPIPPPSSITLSGVAYDHTLRGREARAGVPLVIHVWQGPHFLNVTTDATGRYELSGVPSGAISIAPSTDASYRAPCPAGWDVVHRDWSFDVEVISTTLLSTSGAPLSWPKRGIYFSGVVSEATPNGARPLAGATVDLATDDSDRWLQSSTLTDAAGRYLVCTSPPEVGTDQESWVRVSREGYYPASARVLGGGGGVNLTLLPRHPN